MKAATLSLEQVAQEFHRVRSQKKGHPRFSEELWQAAFNLTMTYSVAEIASAIGVSVQVL